jgi:PAS domain S-box-containing protein
MAEILGYTPEELIGKPGLDFCDPKYHNLCQEANRRVSRGERQFYEIELSGKDGRRVWVGVNGSPFYDHQGNYTGNLGLYTDISEQKSAKEKLQQSQQQLEGLFQNMAEGVVLLDVDGKVLKINLVAARILRLDPDQAPGNYYNNLRWQGEVILEDGTIISREILSRQQIAGLGRTIVNEEASLKFPDGTLTWLRGSITPLMDSTRGVIGTIVTFADITKEKMQQEQLTHMLLEGQEQERKRIARELHDDTAQSLSIISLELDSIIARKKFCDEETIVKIAQQKSALDRTMQDVRRFSHELHPSILDYLGLVSALEQLVEEINERNEIALSFNTRGEEIKLSSDKELAVFRVVQEALSNIRKHAAATQASVSLQYLPNSIKLRISDNGKGFNVRKESEAAILRGSLGLVSMKERAHLVGAKIKVESRMDQGTSITLEIGLDRSEVDQTKSKP